MHIKQICISNFRSFRQQAELRPAFHEGTNCIVGRNGSGKSNLLDAVQFCLLSPSFANLRQEERQRLLHQGSGSAALSAFVEIIFDNTDGRMAVDDDEVVIRRVVGLKKDEMFLQRKRATKSSILSLLEGAGFSKSNPYFLVQQGRIQELCVADDAKRLDTLKDVAGTTVYDNKKVESLAQMEDNNDKIEKVKEILERIEERLAQLQSETEELEQFSAADKERRGCEYCLYEAELQKAQVSLGHIEEERAKHALSIAELHEQAKDTHDAIRSMEGQLHAKAAKLRQNARQLSLLEQDVKEGTQKKTQLALECQELQSQLKAADEAQVEAATQLAHVEAEIEKTEALLGKLTPQLRQAEAALLALQHERTKAAEALESLRAKQGRGNQFGSKQERDAYLQVALDDVSASMEDAAAQVSSQRDALASSRRSIQATEKEIQTHQTSLEAKAAAAASLTKSLADKRRERQALQESRKSDWRLVEQLRDQVREARHEWQVALGDSRKSMPRATAMGLQALETLVEQERLTKDEVFGTVLENIRLKHDKYSTAVEVAAQNALFHVIVRDDDVAARLLKRLESDKLGRVTFLPLNQLHLDHNANSAAQPIPTSNESDVCALLDVCLEYDPKLSLAMQHVFGRKLLARSQEAASEWSVKCDMDAITLDGDLVSRKGAISGGYVDTTKSRWAAHVALEKTKSTLDRLQADYQRASRRADQVDQQNSTLMQEIQKFESKHAEVTNSVKALETSLERLQTRLEQQRKNQDKLEKSTIPNLEHQVENLQAEKSRIEEEMGTELSESLSNRDKQEIESLKADLLRLATEMQEQSDTVARLAAEHQNATSLLKDNLLKRKDELTGGGVDDDDEDEEGQQSSTGASARRRRGANKSSPPVKVANRRRSSILHRLTFSAIQVQRQHDLEERQAQLTQLTSALVEMGEQLKVARNDEASLRAQVVAEKDELEQLKTADAKNIKLLEDAQEKSERLLNKRSTLTSIKESKTQLIQGLGSLPSPAELQKFSGKSIAELTRLLGVITKKLKTFSHVNKKAYDQYVSFNEQRDSLLARKEELDKGSLKIQELIDSLDQQKDEAINRTFRGVSAHFKSVFSELVPTGAGELIMHTAIGEDSAEESDEELADKAKKHDPNNPDVSLYRGVGIKVRFSPIGENFMMSQLSGGQKALVALALIFAIQRCDPAPFYIFDELDQALDSSYRAAVASVIERQANNKESPTQFIVTTFRPELVSIANRTYGISLQNKVSNLHHMEKRGALEFVADLMKEEEDVGGVTKLQKSRASVSAFVNRKRKSDEATSVGADDQGDEEELVGGTS